MMSKGVLVCLAFATANIAAMAQVTTDGSTTVNSVPYFKNSATQLSNSPISVSNGNVGIGTTSPGSKLQVIGAAFIGENTNGTVVIDAYNGDAFFGDNSSTNGIAVNPSGYVGIGVTNPQTLLQVGNNVSGIAESGYKGLIMIQGGADLNSGVNGLELKTSTYGSGFGWKILSADRGNGNAPLSFAYRNNNTAWTELVTMRSDTGRIGIGTASPARTLEIAGDVQIDGNLYFGSNPQPQSAPYAGCTGGDYAESMDVSGDPAAYAPGEVLVLDPAHPGRILKSIEAYSTAVAGVYSTRPGTIGRRQLTPKSAAEVPMAMVGVVPVKVTAENGPIRVGDLLVSSSTPGYAMRGSDSARMLGAVIGKAMAPLDSATGAIEILVTLQ